MLIFVFLIAFVFVFSMCSLFVFALVFWCVLVSVFLMHFDFCAFAAVFLFAFLYVFHLCLNFVCFTRICQLCLLGVVGLLMRPGGSHK